MCFFQWDPNIFKLCFLTFQRISYITQIFGKLCCLHFENMSKTLKIKDSTNINIVLQICISAIKARVFMKFYVVVNYYLVSLIFKCHDDPCTNARAQVVNTHTRDKMCARGFTARARAFIHESLWNMKYKPTRQ